MEKLLSILYDKNASEAEKDDAIIDLSIYYDDDIFLEEIFMKIIKELNLSNMLLASIGEALAAIWLKENSINIQKLNSLQLIARIEAINCIKKTNPNLLVKL